jgi:hypothetical protein
MNRFIRSLAIVTTLSYHYYKIAIANHTMNTTDCSSLRLPNWQIYHESPLCRLDTDCIENASSDVLLEAMLIVQLPSNKLQWCIHYCYPHSRLRECLPSRCLVTTTFLYCSLPSYCLATVWSNPLQYASTLTCLSCLRSYFGGVNNHLHCSNSPVF